MTAGEEHMIKKLTACIGEYKKPSFLAAFTVFLEVIMEIVIPYLMADLLDKGVYAGSMNVILKYGVMLVIFAILSMLFGMLAGRYAAVASCGFARNLRRSMFHNVQEFAFENIDKFSTASLVTRLTTDVTNVQNAYQMIVRTAIRAPFMLIFSFAAAFRINHELSMIFICVIPFLAVGLGIVIKHAHPRFVRVFKTYDKLNSVVQENLLGIRVVKSFVREEDEKRKFGKISEQIYDDFSTAEKILAFNMPLMQISVYTCMLLISWLGAKIIVASGNELARGLSTGGLMSLMTYSSQILMSLMMVSMVFVMIIMARASAERIAEVLGEESVLENCDNPLHEVKDGSIEFKNVTFRYNKTAGKPCLDNINMKIKSGETIGIIGATGSAKSTLVQLIPRLYDVTEGAVLVGGDDVRSIDIETLRDAVSVVLQKNVLFSGTIKENLRWGDENATDEDIRRVCALACADEFIEKLPDGYDTYIEQGGTNVSGGQRQRLCIARALLKKPKILILDDSTSAVDTKTDAKIRSAFRTEIPDTTKLIIAQRISSVQDADRVLILDDGKILAFGSHDELMKTSDVYREIYMSQVKGGSVDEQNEQE